MKVCPGSFALAAIAVKVHRAVIQTARLPSLQQKTRWHEWHFRRMLLSIKYWPRCQQIFSSQEANMYAVIRRYQFDPKSSEEIGRLIRDGFIQLLRKTPGFVSYNWLDTGSGVGASMGVFQDKAGAQESVRLA